MSAALPVSYDLMERAWARVTESGSKRCMMWASEATIAAIIALGRPGSGEFRIKVRFMDGLIRPYPGIPDGELHFYRDAGFVSAERIVEEPS